MMSMVVGFLVGAMVGAFACWHYATRRLREAKAEHEAALRGLHPLFRLIEWVGRGAHTRSVEVSRWEYSGWEARTWESLGPSDGAVHRKFRGRSPFDAAEQAAAETVTGGSP